MTGNLVLLGLSASTRDGALAAHAGASLCGYVVGAVVGSRICRPVRTPAWPRTAVVALAVELSALFVVAVIRGAVSGALPAPLEAVLLGVTAVAMGLQSAVGRAAPAVRRSTTYLTGSLTDLLASMSAGEGLARERQALGVLVAAVLGAGADAALVTFVPRTGPLLSVACVGAVLALVVRDRRSVAVIATEVPDGV